MPEAPDLQVIKEFLETRLTGRTVTSARELKPLVLRNLVGRPLSDDASGRIVEKVRRHGKLLFIDLSDDRTVVINPMLAGGLRYCQPSERLTATTFVVLGFDNGHQLRYFDQKKMGMVYYATRSQAGTAPRVEDQGPDVLDEKLSLQEFTERLKPFRGEIKGFLTRGGLVSGVGNAYSDEILFDARLFPFKKRTALTVEQVADLHRAVYAVPEAALKILRRRVGDDIHLKIRDFLKVHGKAGEACPRCGHTISAITANQRETNFCRSCQPGFLPP